MADDRYAALRAAWALLPAGDTTAQKLAAINAMEIPGPAQDVPVSAVVGYLALAGKFAAFMAYASTATGAAAMAAKELAAVISCPNAPDFAMSNTAAAAILTGYLSAVVSDPASSLDGADQNAILALATPPIAWRTAPVADGGGGLGGLVTESDLGPAGGLA